jgi:hypothetical protein
MRLFIKTLPQFLLLTFGGAIVLLSLLSANRVFSQGVGFELAKQRFYFQADIMPDHLIYPAVVGVERLRLAFIDGNQEVNMRIGYAWKRLDHTQA